MDRVEYQKILERGGVADLSARFRLRLSGADRIRYLNGQVTANVQTLQPGSVLPACVTTAKGKLCAVIMIALEPDTLFIDADAALSESLPPRLERYMIADDVELTVAPESECLLHFIGPDPRERVPALRDAAIRSASRFGVQGWDLCAPRETIASTAIESHYANLDADFLESLRIERGVPRWGYELDESTLPPEAGLDQTHIDFHKGCYIGQEVISRLKSVGHVNRHLAGFVSIAGNTPAAGDEVFSGADREKSIGRLTSVAWSFALEKSIALGYLKRSAVTNDLVAVAPDSARPDVSLAVRNLPFTS
jgi:folate-binding protein YgfZ